MIDDNTRYKPVSLISIKDPFVILSKSLKKLASKSWSRLGDVIKKNKQKN